MRKPSAYSLLLFVVLLINSCGHSTKSENTSGDNNNNTATKYADLVLIEDFFDFGSIVQGEVVSHTFHFKNGGNDVLKIKDLIPDCGCTKPKIEKMIYNPGEDGVIEVAFNSSEWQGSQYKSVTLRTNSPIKDKSVTIKANVVVPKE